MGEVTGLGLSLEEFAQLIVNRLNDPKPDLCLINDMSISFARAVRHAANGALSAPRPAQAAQAAAPEPAKAPTDTTTPPKAQATTEPPRAVVGCSACGDAMMRLARIDLAAQTVRMVTLAMQPGGQKANGN